MVDIVFVNGNLFLLEKLKILRILFCCKERIISISFFTNSVINFFLMGLYSKIFRQNQVSHHTFLIVVMI